MTASRTREWTPVGAAGGPAGGPGRALLGGDDLSSSRSARLDGERTATIRAAGSATDPRDRKSALFKVQCHCGIDNVARPPYRSWTPMRIAFGGYAAIRCGWEEFRPWRSR